MSTSRMRTEIGEQPAALRRTIDGLLPRLSDIGRLARDTRQVLFIARGSSDNAAVYGRYLVESHTGRLATLAAPSIATTYKRDLDLSGVLAVAISQSGKTEEIVQTLDWAARCGARTVAVTNGAGSPLAEAAEVALITEAGEELAVPATKTYTTQLAALAVLGLGLGADVDAEELRGVPDEVARVIEATEASAALPEIVAALARVPGAVVSGRGIAFGTALELALKIKEACYLHAMGLSYADLLHGPIAVVDAQTPALLVAADSGPTLPGTVALAERVRGAGAQAFGIGGGAGLAGASTAALAGPDLPEWVAPLGLIVPGQILVENLARALGLDPDVPRGLNKVTQTD
ncbi:SIS domain-containing protein [Actinomadura macrotermitis]|uniref:Glutamine--fructose-6-phosphate aminotransferase [isomerizing] n=1 Tax=Actinomadura macrotermitis TaxID=2585200 RepID=A0A7K0C159_9ACTN|nr:SIS domain-containing protein [Actinomadura macrotermitis]MQY07096.1 Glutamine--fructose-6-phosphate aminotransferase [isomerizing] [Actinomadura macrotermitis]